MIDVSGRQLQQSLYPSSSRTVGRGGYQQQQPQECLTPVTSVAATPPTAVAMIGCAQSTGRGGGTAPSRALDFPFQQVQQQSLQKDLDEPRLLQNPLFTQLPRQQGDVSSDQQQGTFQSPLHCSSEQQEVQICGQLSPSRCQAQLDMVTSSGASSSAVDKFGSAVSPQPASSSHQLHCDLKVSCPSSVSQLPSLTASSVSPTSSSLLIFSSSSSSQLQQQQQQVHRKHSSPNHHQSGNSYGLQPQPHHRQQQLSQQKLTHKKNLSFLLQPYHFQQPNPTHTASSSVAPVTEDSSCSGMMLTSCTSTNNTSIGSINSSSSCGGSSGGGDGSSSSSVEVSVHRLSDPCGNTRQSVAYITDKLRRQIILDSGSPQQRSQREHQESPMLAEVEKCYSSPSKHSASTTNTDPDPWKIRVCHSECTGLNATVQSMLSLKLGETLEKKKVYQTLPPSGACTKHSSCMSTPILSHSSASSSLISDALHTRGYGSSLAGDCSVSNSTDVALVTSDVGSDNDTIKDTSPGTPPYPPKKKHCRSLSIPSESGSQKPRDVSAAANNANYFVALELSPRNSGSLLKPVAFNPLSEDSWSQYQRSFSSAEGESVSGVSGISSSTLFSSLTTQPAVFSGAFHWPTTVDPSSASPETQHTFAAVLDPISCSTRLHKSVTLLHTPPESPVPRPASVSIVGYHDDDDVENRAFKPVSDMWTRHGYHNSGFSSPSSCSSSSSFPLQPRPHPTTVTSQTTGSSCFLTMTHPTAYASSPFAAPPPAAASSSSPSSSPVKLATTSCSLPPHTPFWSFQKHRSLSLEDQCSISNSTSPSSFSPSSSILSSPSHPHHPHHYPSHPHAAPHYPHSRQQQALLPPTPHHHPPPPPTQIIPTQRLVPPHHQHHHQQQQQLRKTVSAGGSTPSVPAACKTSVSNPSSPRRQRIPRCRSQPCVLHDRKAGVKRRRDYDRPTLDFHKMTQTAYGNSPCQTEEASEQILQNLYQGPKVSWFQQFPEDQTTTVKQSLNPTSVSGPVSIEVLRSTCLLPDDHTDDAMSEDAEISAATEAGEAAARAAATAAAAKKPTADEYCPDSHRNIRQINFSDDGCPHWDDASFERPFVSGQSVGPAGWDPLVYASDESNPSFCGCDDDDEDDDDGEEGEDRMNENEDYYGRDKPPIADLDVDQIENH